MDRVLEGPKSGRGYEPRKFVRALVWMLHAGGRRLEDLRELRAEHAVLKELGLEAVPDAGTMGDWLRRQGQVGAEAMQQVNQKLIESGTFGGYTDAAGDPTPSMASQIKFVDASIGQMVEALEDQHLLNSTVIIITAKHGQSPIDNSRFFPIPGHSGTNGMPPSQILASLLPLAETTGFGSNPGGLRMKDEFAAHKVLDAVGDLSLAGAALHGQFIAYRPGHCLNNKLLKALFARRGAWADITRDRMDAAAAA